MTPRLALFALVLASAGLPTRAPAAPEPPAAPLVIGDTFTIDSKVLGETRRINVYAPPGHGGPKADPLPVLYMPDGGLGEDFLHVAGLIEVLVGDGAMRPFRLVGIENTQRRRDLTGPTEDPEDKRIAPQVGGSAAFRRFLREELMPQIRARYRTTAESAIVGESLAGLFAVETFLLEPDLFDTYVAFDPSLWWNRQQFLRDAPERLHAQAGGRARKLYFAYSGDPGAPELGAKFAGILLKSAPPSLQWHYEPMADERHSTIYHPAALRAFRAVFAPLPGR